MHRLSFSMAEAEKVVVLISSFFQVSPGLTQRRGAGLSCVCTVWPRREDSSLPQRSQCGACWSGIPHLGSTQELHHPLLEIGKLHKGKTLNQESTVHCNIYRVIHVPPVLLQIRAKCEMILSLIFEEMQRALTMLTLKVSSTLLWATEIVRIFEKAQQTSTPQSHQ